ncbi:MAG: T9SS type A sorting domain-containing protein [Bacteroidales bacterium]|nr:T9SS type A sorting domain-containing protein [Bacteroidales bacterium]
MKKKLLLLHVIVCIMITIPILSKAQEIRLDTLEANPGDTLLVHLKFYGLLDVGAITLYIAFDTTVMDFIEITNLIPEAAGTLANALPQGDDYVVGISWLTSGVGVNFPDGVVLDIKFYYKGASSGLMFTELCEVVDWEVNPIGVTYFDGYVYEHVVGITEHAPSADVQISAFSDCLFFELPAPQENLNLSIYDISGRLVHSSFYQTFFRESIPVTLNKGVHLIILNKNGFNTSKKIYIH